MNVADTLKAIREAIDAEIAQQQADEPDGLLLNELDTSCIAAAVFKTITDLAFASTERR